MSRRLSSRSIARKAMASAALPGLLPSLALIFRTAIMRLMRRVSSLLPLGLLRRSVHGVEYSDERLGIWQVCAQSYSMYIAKVTFQHVEGSRVVEGFDWMVFVCRGDGRFTAKSPSVAQIAYI